MAWVRSALPCPGTVAQQGGPALRPETAKPGAGRTPIWGESRGPRPSGFCAPHAPRSFPYRLRGKLGRRSTCQAGDRIPRGSGERPPHPSHVVGGHQFFHYSQVRVDPFTGGGVVTGLGIVIGGGVGIVFCWRTMSPGGPCRETKAGKV